MINYNPFLDAELIKKNTLRIIKQIINLKQQNHNDELIANKLNLEYLDWSNSFQNDPEKACGHFILGTFATYDLEVHFLVYKNQEIGFEISLNQKDNEIKEIFIFENNTLTKGPGYNNLLNKNFNKQ